MAINLTASWIFMSRLVVGSGKYDALLIGQAKG